MSRQTSRSEILERIRSAGRPDTPHPGAMTYSVPGDPLANFRAKLKACDGESHTFASRAEALDWLRTQVPEGKVVFSAVPDFQGNITESELADPHAAHVVDICVAQGEAGVGETGSVWVSDVSLRVAAAALFSTDLYLLLDTTKVFPTLQEAYTRIDLGSEQYGAFYTGPSATADIEAVHITGAQGEISLTVLLYPS